MREPWNFEDPLCREVGADFFFPEKEDGDSPTLTKYAKSICASCSHRIECAEWGINNERFGIWGGLTQTDMRIVRKKNRILIEELGEDVA
jgi:WhiB family redox-sensing transcriptional regulator